MGEYTVCFGVAPIRAASEPGRVDVRPREDVHDLDGVELFEEAGRAGVVRGVAGDALHHLERLDGLVEAPRVVRELAGADEYGVVGHGLP